MPHLFTHKLILGADAPSITIGSTMLPTNQTWGFPLFSFPLWIPAKR